VNKTIDTLFSGALFHTLRTEDETFRFLGETNGKITFLSDTYPEDIRCKKKYRLTERTRTRHLPTPICI
jgi:hypothetical protein